MQQPLHNKRILFFAPKFFGYELAIKEKLIAMGAHVVYYDERPKNTFWTKALLRINRDFVKQTIQQYYAQILAETKNQKYDYIFVVNLEAMTPEIVSQFREQQPQAKFVLYMWDSIRNKKPAQLAFPLFDWCYSFDKNDAQTLKNVIFRPLFFIDVYDAKKWEVQPKIQYDLCFIGTVHSDRYNLLNAIKKQLQAHGKRLFFYMYFHNRILFFYKKLRDVRFIGARFDEFSFTPISANSIIEKIKQSAGVLDIQHPFQTGLTMRTIEMIGAEKKLITTNKAVVEYDFYNPVNILVIDRDEPVINQDFLNKPYQKLDTSVRDFYSVEGWLKTIFKLQ